MCCQWRWLFTSLSVIDIGRGERGVAGRWGAALKARRGGKAVEVAHVYMQVVCARQEYVAFTTEAAPKSYQPFALVSMDHCGPFPV